MKRLWAALPEPVRGGLIVSGFALASAGITMALAALAGGWIAAAVIGAASFAFGAGLTVMLDD